MSFGLATVERAGEAIGCIVADRRCHALSSAPASLGLPADVMSLFGAWDRHFDALQRFAARCWPSDGWPSDEAKHLAPLHYPGKVLCAGANYFDLLAEMGVPDLRKEAQRLFFFFKPPRNALVGHGAVVEMPLGTQMFDWEIELALVIGKRSKRLRLDNALDAVAAYAVAIDFSARDLNQAPNTFYKLDWVAGKAQDTCCPLGPQLVPAAFIHDPQTLHCA